MRNANFALKGLSSLPIACLLASGFIRASEIPPWWVDSEFGFWNGDASEHYAPVNVGQLKYTSVQAAKYLKATLGDEAVAELLSALDFYDFTNDQVLNKQDSFAPANVGQLKYIASEFYKVLDTTGYPIRASLIHQGVEPSEISERDGVTLPWSPMTVRSENFAPANIGQLKLVFSFSILGTGESSYNLDYILSDDLFDFSADDIDGDLWGSGVEDLLGFGSEFDEIGVLSGTFTALGFMSAVQSVSSEPGPVIIVPGKGYFKVYQPALNLGRL